MDKETILSICREAVEAHGASLDERSLLLGYMIGAQWTYRNTSSPEMLRMNLDAFFEALWLDQEPVA